MLVCAPKPGVFFRASVWTVAVSNLSEVRAHRHSLLSEVYVKVLIPSVLCGNTKEIQLKDLLV